MNKSEFLLALRLRLSCLPKEDIASAADYYAELISDRVEEGMGEEEAVVDIGSVDAIADEIIANTPLTRLVKAKIKPKKKINALNIVLLVLGSPIWLSLLIAAFAVVLSLYIVLWTVVICLYAADLALAAGGIGGTVAAIALICEGNVPAGIMLLGASIVCAGLAILMFLACNKAAKGAVLAGRGVLRGIKRCFFGRRKEK